MSRLDWNEYTNDRLIAQHPCGFYVVKPKEPLQGRPLFCAVCERIMNSLYDPEAYQKFGCCDSCAATWAYPRASEWNAGWRPSEDEVRNKRRNSNM